MDGDLKKVKRSYRMDLNNDEFIKVWSAISGKNSSRTINRLIDLIRERISEEELYTYLNE
jgi:hypothetical protein